MPSAWRAIGPGFAAGIVACTLVTSLDDLTSGAADAGTDTARCADENCSITPVDDGGSDTDAGPEAMADASDVDAACPIDGMDGGFCDDFERGDFSRWSSKSTNGNGFVAIISADAGVFWDAGGAPFRGVYAFQASATKAADGGMVQASLNKYIGPVNPGNLALRAHIYVPAALAQSTSFFWLGQDDGAGKAWYAYVYTYYSGDTWDVTFSNSAATTSHRSIATVPIGRWFCFELDLTLGASGHVAFAIDDTLLIDDDENTTGALTTTDGSLRLGTGFLNSSGARAEQILYDDVALIKFADVAVTHAPRLGCR
jgi:hypothetical protein